MIYSGSTYTIDGTHAAPRSLYAWLSVVPLSFVRFHGLAFLLDVRCRLSSFSRCVGHSYKSLQRRRLFGQADNRTVCKSDTTTPVDSANSVSCTRSGCLPGPQRLCCLLRSMVHAVPFVSALQAGDRTASFTATELLLFMSSRNYGI